MEVNLNFKFCAFLLLTLLWFLFMTYLSHQNGEETGKTSIELAKHLKKWFHIGKIDTDILNCKLRKWAHTGLFFVWTLLVCLTLHQTTLSSYIKWMLFVLVPIWAWADERTKTFMKGRHFSWFDTGLNLLGVVLGVIVFFLFLL